MSLDTQTNIPAARSHLRRCLECIKVENYEDAAFYAEEALKLMTRKYGQRAGVTSSPCTTQMARAIREFKREHPFWSQQKIANHFNVNPGRVSEALRGLR